jgi:hypothetical protein
MPIPPSPSTPIVWYGAKSGDVAVGLSTGGDVALCSVVNVSPKPASSRHRRQRPSATPSARGDPHREQN